MPVALVLAVSLKGCHKTQDRGFSSHHALVLLRHATIPRQKKAREAVFVG
jgi:hypothetical protein